MRRVEGAEGIVEIEIETRNQKGEAVVSGNAIAALPARS